MNALQTLRKNNSMTASAMSSSLNMKYSTYCNIEKNRDELSLDQLLAIATTFNVPLSDLIDDPQIRQIAKQTAII